MNLKSIDQKAPRVLHSKNREPLVCVNGETNSMALPFSIAGSSVGVIVGIVASIFLTTNYELNSRFKFLLFLIPLFFVFFGALAGTFVGIGTPRRNRNPKQGWWVSLRRFYSRRNFDKKLKET